MAEPVKTATDAPESKPLDNVVDLPSSNPPASQKPSAAPPVAQAAQAATEAPPQAPAAPAAPAPAVPSAAPTSANAGLERLQAETQKQLEELRARLDAQTAEMAKREAQARDSERLRVLGAIAGGLVSEDYARLAPEADPFTDEGRGKLVEWAKSNATLFKGFAQPTGPAQPVNPRRMTMNQLIEKAWKR